MLFFSQLACIQCEWHLKYLISAHAGFPASLFCPAGSFITLLSLCIGPAGIPACSAPPQRVHSYERKSAIFQLGHTAGRRTAWLRPAANELDEGHAEETS